MPGTLRHPPTPVHPRDRMARRSSHGTASPSPRQPDRPVRGPAGLPCRAPTVLAAVAPARGCAPSTLPGGDPGDHHREPRPVLPDQRRRRHSRPAFADLQVDSAGLRSPGQPGRETASRRSDPRRSSRGPRRDASAAGGHRARRGLPGLRRLPVIREVAIAIAPEVALAGSA